MLGRAGLGHGKAAALVADLRLRHPYTDLKAELGRAESLVAAGAVDLGLFDLVVIAVDDMTAALHLSRALASRSPRQGTIYAWLDPMGLGGHVLTALPDARGCLRCLFTRPTTGGFIQNRASFVGEGQQVEVALGGCGNRFTPFGMLDASQTANLATRAALDVLLQQGDSPSLRSWKGDAGGFRDAGYATSARYSLPQTTLDRARHEFVAPSCQQCSTGAGVHDGAASSSGEAEAGGHGG